MISRLLTILTLTALAGAHAQAARIVAIGDVHGEIAGFNAVLAATGLVDETGRWAGGDAILVQTGDLTDRGSEVRAVLDRMRELEAEAPSQGGRVVALLGNHEIANLVHRFDLLSTPKEVYHRIWAAFAGQSSERRQRAAYKRWRRWHQRYPGCVDEQSKAWVDDRKAWLADHPPGWVEYLEAFSAEGEYGRWLRGLDVAAEIDGSIFLHGGVSPQLVERGYRSVAAINEAAARALAQLDEIRGRLIDDGLILPVSTLWEVHCTLYVEMARLELDGGEEALARRAELAGLRERLPGTGSWFLDDPAGPVWFRGLAPDPTGARTEEVMGAEEVAHLLAELGAERMIVGHTPQPGQIVSRAGGRVFLIDTAMAYPELGGRSAALEIAGDRISAIYDGERVALAPAPAASAPAGGSGLVEVVWGPADYGRTASPRQQPPAAAETTDAEPATTEPAEAPRVWIGPDGEPLPFASTEELLEFLAEAKVIHSERTPIGITEPRKLLLERDGVRAHAIFHDVALEKGRERLQGGKVITFFRDHYANNVAAFELGRMLGIDNVPPAVVRRYRSREGSVQMWIENTHSEAERRSRNLPLEGEQRSAARDAADDMWVFDNLIYNFDRNQGNILFDASWNLWLIDHTRAFNRLRQLPDPQRIRRCSRRLWRALHELDEAEVTAALRPYLGIYEIRAIFARRDRLVELVEEQIRQRGEAAVLFSPGEPADGPGDLDIDIPEEPARP